MSKRRQTDEGASLSFLRVIRWMAQSKRGSYRTSGERFEENDDSLKNELYYRYEVFTYHQTIFISEIIHGHLQRYSGLGQEKSRLPAQIMLDRSLQGIERTSRSKSESRCSVAPVPISQTAGYCRCISTLRDDLIPHDVRRLRQ